MRAAPRSVRQLLLALVLAVSLAGCGTAAGPPLATGRVDPWPGATTLMRSELFFGRSRPDGSMVSDAQWRAFVDDHVTPRFPDGLTVVDASGQYRTRAGELVREASKIVILLHEPDARSRAAIEEIRALYRKLFDQESVLLVSGVARVAF